ncbi:2-methylaconitate cis-trans-isomerase PrpF [Sporomusaceae bacterium BoRhaA]|uniref:2-methylaconitate cis-trans isomerase PrpF family protein n=1 Tax=Pelorhabdus rhamnosifermentans TaxID=2772457 RepID=UPI001C061DA6|nr:PrpF domain-containing protein [Pelorhabdus rhamnosifermentans]MBU2703309.1 2-methylaconitate cis-trans-isomerase PrpF [Pelorhabdus rhamnosifermentans]
MGEYIKIPAVLMRGGTSKGVYLLAQDLPEDLLLRDKVILDIYGSPDVRQINGIGGADPLTSKVAIVAASDRENVDVDYTFGYVGIKDAVVDYEGNCGNMSSGVGPFAIGRGLVTITEPITKVRIYNTNTKKVIVAEIPVKDGEVVTEGDYAIDGVPGTGAKIVLNFLNSGGSKTGKLLPTGNVIDEIRLQCGKKVRVSLVDAANPSVFVKAIDIGLTGVELPQDTETKPEILEIMEDIRTTAAVMMGLAASKEQVGPAVPKVAFVSAPQEYVTINGVTVKANDVDLVARTKAMAVMHKAYAVTGGICVSTAALIEGTVVNEIVSERAKRSGIVRVGHPSGILDFEINLEKEQKNWHLSKAGVSRTAKPIMDGQVYVSRKVFTKD